MPEKDKLVKEMMSALGYDESTQIVIIRDRCSEMTHLSIFLRRMLNTLQHLDSAE